MTVTCPKTGFRCFLLSGCEKAGRCKLDPAQKPKPEAKS